MTRLLTALLILAASSAGAQTVDPSGHWEGAITAPMGEIRIAVDLTRSAGGTLTGTFSNLSEGLIGFPLSSAMIEGRAMTLEMKANRGNETLRGTLSADGRSIDGDFLISVYAVPFTLTRTGDARIAPVPASPAFDRTLEGSWRGTLQIGSNALPVDVRLVNRSDGTATGTWSTDGGAGVPVLIVHEGSLLTLRSPVTNGSYAGTVSADRSEIAGTLTMPAGAFPLVFRRLQGSSK